MLDSVRVVGDTDEAYADHCGLGGFVRMVRQPTGILVT